MFMGFYFPVPLLQLSLTFSTNSLNPVLLWTSHQCQAWGEWDVGKSPTQTHIHGSRSLKPPPPLQQAQFSTFQLKAYFQQDLIAGFVSFINISIFLCGRYGMVWLSWMSAICAWYFEGSAIATWEILVMLVMHIERKKQLFRNKIDRG
jgi:hypothetical protein